MTANLTGKDVSRDAMRDALTGSGLTPHFEWLRADTLKMPGEYQRTLYPHWAKKIARNLDPDKFWPLIISRRADGDYVLDGQHRLVAVRDVLDWHDQNVPCEVYTGLTPQLEAKLFATQASDTRKHIKAMERLHADIASGDPEAIGVALTVKRAGLLLDRDSGDAECTVRAADSLRRMYRGQGPARLLAVLTLLRDTFGIAARTFQSDMLNGVSSFLLRYTDDPHYDREEFVRKFKVVGMDAVLQRSRLIQAGLGQDVRGGSGAHVGRALHAIYNSGKRTRHLGDWQDRPTIPEDMQRSMTERGAEKTRQQFAQGTRPLAGNRVRPAANEAAD